MNTMYLTSSLLACNLATSWRFGVQSLILRILTLLFAIERRSGRCRELIFCRGAIYGAIWKGRTCAGDTC